jgi:hypothetical protein
MHRDVVLLFCLVLPFPKQQMRRKGTMRYCLGGRGGQYSLSLLYLLRKRLFEGLVDGDRTNVLADSELLLVLRIVINGLQLRSLCAHSLYTYASLIIALIDTSLLGHQRRILRYFPLRYYTSAPEHCPDSPPAARHCLGNAPPCTPRPLS